MKGYKTNKVISKKKSKKYIKKGGTKCSIDIPQKIESVVNTGNCNIGKTDCFNNPKPLPQLGILPTSPNLSEVAFDGRYCCSVNNSGSQYGGNNKEGVINIKDITKSNLNIIFYVSNGKFSTEGINIKKAQTLKNQLKQININAKIKKYDLGGFQLYFSSKQLYSKIIENPNFNHIGGNGYYLSLDNCPPGGLSTVKGYDSCCPPVFSGQLSGNTNNYIYNPFQNQYYVPNLQKNIQGGKKKTLKIKGGYASLGFKTYPSWCDGKENWSQCGISSNTCSNT